MSLTEVAKETLEIVKRGTYQSKTGAIIQLKPSIVQAVAGTRLYTPQELEVFLQVRKQRSGEKNLPKIEITKETTGEAAKRLYELEGEQGVVALNFASAKNPGGGFLGEAKAQEEDLARCSALYNCQLTQTQYYDANRSFRSLLYSDHIIYSPKVPFFRGENLELLDEPFFISIITSPAPNANALGKVEPISLQKIGTTLERRAGMILCVAAEQGHRVLVLGAWGCGVFGNNPSDVSQAFATWLNHPGFSGAFDRVIFGIYERNKNRPFLEAFRKTFNI